MAYDKQLAQRVRRTLEQEQPPNISEREMFGGIAFMVNGNLACGVLGEELLVRVGAERHPSALKESHVRVFDFTGRPSKGIVLVGMPGLATSGSLKKWVKLGVNFALTLPPK